MAITQTYTMVILIIAFGVSITMATEMQEVCQWETFEAKCQEDEVIMIKEAHYGRMRFGRCQRHKYFVGCSADVSTIMHARCSGRQHCSIPVPDPVLFAASPCNKDLVSYLEADYECVKVAKSNTDNCNDNILTALNGDIAKPLADSKPSSCPHRILAQPGQTMNVYLYDFYSKDSKSETIPDCITYGYVSENNKMTTEICGGEFRKNHLIYSSKGNVVDITLTELSSHSHHYLLHYEVGGCPTIQSPPNAFVKIQDNTATVMCNFSHIATHLVCAGNEWVGEIQNCTSFNANLLADPIPVGSFSFTNSTIFPIACIAAAILFGIGVLMLVKARHMKAKQIADLPELSVLEKSPLPANEKSFKPGDEYQPVYVPVHQNNLYEGPRPSVLPTLKVAHRPIVENIYGPLGGNRTAPMHICKHSIYNITGLSLGEDNVINMEGTLLN